MYGNLDLITVPVEQLTALLERAAQMGIERGRGDRTEEATPHAITEQLIRELVL